MLDKLNALLDAIPESSVSWKLWTFLAIVAGFLIFGAIFSYFGREKGKRSEESAWLTLIAVVILGCLVGVFINSSFSTASNNRLSVAAHLAKDPLIYELLTAELSYDPAIMQVDLFAASTNSETSNQLTLFSRTSSDSKDGKITQSIELARAPTIFPGILSEESSMKEPSVKRPTAESFQMLTWAKKLAADERPQVLVTYSNGQQSKLEATFDQSSKLVLVAPQGINVSTVRMPVDPR